MGRDLCRTDAAACRSSAGILLVLTQEGPAVLEFQERARSRRDAGATETIGSSATRLSRAAVSWASPWTAPRRGGGESRKAPGAVPTAMPTARSSAIAITWYLRRWLVATSPCLWTSNPTGQATVHTLPD